MASEKIMHLAEALYQSGYISYPRTETNKYPDTFQNGLLMDLVRNQKQSDDWGFYANNLLDQGNFQRPRAGKQDDKAHPPIHPIKLANKNQLKPDEWRVYEFVTRHFLATCGKDAVGAKTEVEVKFNDETFQVDGLVVKEKNYLDVWVYEKWNDAIVPPLVPGQVIIPSKILLQEGKTTAPKPLTESELIDQMNKNGIGTDATMHDHILTIQKRGYALKNASFQFTPTSLGLALCNAYEQLGFTLSKPDLRAKMERLMTDVAEGKTTRQAIITEIMGEMTTIFKSVEQNKQRFIQCVGENLQEQENGANKLNNCKVLQGSECGQCGQEMELQVNEYQKQLVCNPCNKSYSVPKNGSVRSRPEKCPICQFQVIEVNTDKGTSYTLCPSCYNNPPYDQTQIENPTGSSEDSGLKRVNMACYKCINKECSLSGGHKNIPLYKCPSCSSPISIKERKADKKQFIGCTNYPDCGWVGYLPKDIISLFPTAEECQYCKQANRKSMLVEVKYEQGGQYETFCGIEKICVYPGCNPNLKDAGFTFKDMKTIQINGNQQQNPGNNNGNNNNFKNNNFNNNNNFSKNNSASPVYNKNSNNTYNNQFNKSGSGFNKFQNNSTNNNQGQQPNMKYTCYKCKQPGHTINNCPQNQQKGNQPNSYQNQQQYNSNYNTNNFKPAGTSNNTTTTNSNNNNSYNAPQQKSNSQETSQFQSFQFYCTKCDQKGHSASQCPQNNKNPSNNSAAASNQGDEKKKRQQTKCELCGAFRHTKNSTCANNKNQQNN